MHKSSTRIAVAGLALAVFQATLGAQRLSTEVKSPHFTVVSNDFESSARAVAWQLEQVRAALQNVWAWARLDAGRPIVVLALKDEGSMKALAPQYWEQKGGVRPTSVFVEGADRYFIALRTDVKTSDRDGMNPHIDAYWSYVALVLNSSFDGDLPLWFLRGLSSVFSNTLVRDNEIQVGRLIPWHLERLHVDSRLTLRELMTVDRRSPWYSDADRLQTLDAVSWGLVHYLMFGDNGTHRQSFDRFMSSIRAGHPAAAATEEAFGNIDALQGGFSHYYSRHLFEYLKIGVDARTKREALPVRKVAPAESAALRGAFHASMGRTAEARAAADEARRAEAQLPSPYEVDGTLLDGERKFDDARAAYAKAVDLGSTNFYAHYRLAALTFRAGADADRMAAVKSTLERAVALNGRYAPAHALLAEVNARLKHSDEAMAAALRAISLEPGSVHHRLSLARVLWALSRPDDAKSEARRAMTMARSDSDRQDVQELINFFER